MLKLKRLTLSGIGPFVTKQTVEFDELGNLIQVTGVSGAGKTTLFNSLDYLLGVNKVPNTALQTYISKDPIYVEGVFDHDGLPLTMVRTKGKFSVDLNGELTSGSNKLAEEKLDQILGMPRELFRPMFHKRQKEGGFFLNFTPKEMYEFLTDALNLAEYRTKIETIEKKAKELADSRVRLTNEAASNQSALVATQQAVSALGTAPIQEVTQEMISSVKKSSEQSAEKLQQILTDHKAQNAILDQQRPNLQRPSLIEKSYDTSALVAAEATKKSIEAEMEAFVRVEQERLSSLNSQLQSFNVESINLTHKISQSKTAHEQAVVHAGEIKKIRSGICATCEQPWVHDASRAREADLLNKVSTLKTQVEEGNAAQVRLDAIKFQIELVKSQMIPLKDPMDRVHRAKLQETIAIIQTEKAQYDAHHAKQNAENKVLMDSFSGQERAASLEFAEKQTALRLHHAKESEAIRSLAQMDAATYASAVDKFRSYTENKKRFDATSEKLKEQEAAHATKAAALFNQLAELTQELEIVEEIKRAVKSFVSCAFDDALDSIAEAATAYMRNIPNTANVTIQLEGTRETKDGKVKEEINAVIHKDGFQGVPIVSLSGGQRTSVDLAVDLAVIDFLETRANKGINVFILDEPFNGLTTDAIEQAIELLQNGNPDKHVIIVDHNPVIADFINDRITVTQDGPTSNIS